MYRRTSNQPRRLELNETAYHVGVAVVVAALTVFFSTGLKALSRPGDGGLVGLKSEDYLIWVELTVIGLIAGGGLSFKAWTEGHFDPVAIAVASICTFFGLFVLPMIAKRLTRTDTGEVTESRKKILIVDAIAFVILVVQVALGANVNV